MPSKRLMSFWGFVDVCLLAAGVILVVFSELFRMPNLMINFTLSNNFLLSGLITGIFFLITFVVSIGAVVQKNHNTTGLVILNWLLVIDAIVVLVVGTTIWFFSLQQRNNYLKVYNSVSAQTRIQIQDKFSCCGYFTNNDTVEIGGSFCANQTFVDQLVNATDASFGRCVGPITASTDYTLNNVFTTIYGFMAVVITLFLATMCVIKRRQEEERFKRIDAKRGGRGFV
ncbi:tetraspanin [Lentinus tigrinus ALCF2SS1-7]|uniref:Tetraspanin n=1 Tax=Lentinus tigrinus ALCF2SS1-6 TaxID=1328759 RepID=A0A5C2SPT3_9APHY|nr:tetraspanin [Lentinus tigrinus ALCF2SS1-6]RPD79798.1 tetraspanin [Lentinus tigrinus ALCF2SS1-7]